MRPLDPRLVRYASAARVFLVFGGVVAVAQAAGIIAFAWLVTQAVTAAIAGRGLTDLAPTLTVLGLVVAARALLALAQDTIAARGAARVKSQLRDRVLATVTVLGPGWLGGQRSAEIAVVVGRGIDALDGYFARYLPQLLLTAIVTPALLLAVFTQDVLSAVILGVCLPLIPVFMILIGWATQAAQKRQWSELTALSTSFDDMIGGLATLKAYGRQHRQVERLRLITRRFRQRTMAVLRVSFLSSFALELAASLSVALVALTIGLRLVAGEIDLVPGLFILLLAPEVFLPLRQVGVNYHAAAEGVEAAERVFEILDAAPTAVAPEARALGQPEVGGSGLPSALRFREVSIAYDGRTVIDSFTADVRPGALTVMRGPSGSGKSSLVAAALGFVPFSGQVSAGATDRTDVEARRDALAWSGQSATLFPGSIADNVALGVDEADPERVARAMRTAALDALDPETRLGEEGAGLSGGQAQRVAIARAVYRALEDDRRVLVLDEPSSALDHETERRVIDGLSAFAHDGRAVFVVSHRTAFAEAADVLLSVPPVSDGATTPSSTVVLA
ncbi:thiol reductant ABC exporter subunit CydD [Labedella phragmitis]|uniref:Thiol reductant ABC exporter subunit CydD n=1 Tax=Labedella phragmitis TaxID=2498849 RepID=A0A444PVG6_9MICO|nr:thiol reductant ABC exporter subunit CydD [Labedella phragmitis]RWZ51862.1 thiol reductant ABC exporter subunit CydD [Labedella phragmitis]